MQIVRLHDPGRKPADWTGLVQPGQFPVFAKIGASGVPCDTEGRPFANPAAATCAIADSIAEARAFCDAAVQRHPGVQFDVFDSEGRTHSPILTVVHPSRAAALETSPREMRKRRVIAWTLVAAGVLLMVFAYVEVRERDIILPAFLGINMVIIGGRLLWMNFALRETERARERRLESMSPDKQGDAR
jgi:hypothetical protein